MGGVPGGRLRGRPGAGTTGEAAGAGAAGRRRRQWRPGAPPTRLRLPAARPASAGLSGACLHVNAVCGVDAVGLRRKGAGNGAGAGALAGCIRLPTASEAE